MSDMSVMEMKRIAERKKTEKSQLEGEYNGTMKAIREKYEVDSIEELQSLLAVEQEKLEEEKAQFEADLETTRAMDVWN